MLEAEALKLSNQARFILEKCDGSLVVENKKKKVMVEELQRRGFDSDPVKKWKKGQVGRQLMSIIMITHHSNVLYRIKTRSMPRMTPRTRTLSTPASTMITCWGCRCGASPRSARTTSSRRRR